MLKALLATEKLFKYLTELALAVVFRWRILTKNANGGGAWPETPILLVGTIAGFMLIVQSTDGGWTADLTAAMNFNGDDAVGLFKKWCFIRSFRNTRHRSRNILDCWNKRKCYRRPRFS